MENDGDKPADGRPGVIEDETFPHAELPPGLRIGFMCDGLPEWARRIGTLSADDCILEFGQPGPSFPLKSQVVICVRSADEPELMKGPAIVEFRADDALASTYHCRFLDSRKLRGLLPDGIRLFFNRRRAHRILADTKRPIGIRITDPESGEHDVGDLVDLSDFGLTARVERGFEDLLCAARLVRVRFKLPGHEAVEMSAHVRNRRMRLGKVYWGLEFDHETTEGFREQAAIVRSYIMERQESLTPG